MCTWPLKLNNKLWKITRWYSRGGFGCDCERSSLNHLWSARVPIGLKRRANYKFLWRCNNDPIRQVTILSTLPKCEERSACSSSFCRRDALMWNSFERVKERRRGAAESLTLFSNDWFNLLVCVDLFTHITYMLYWINVCRNFPHYKLENCGDE